MPIRRCRFFEIGRKIIQRATIFPTLQNRLRKTTTCAKVY